jgi:Raf kinase inhibitor-like YbhB/YbcL family protein
LVKGVPKDAVLSTGARQRTNSFSNLGYGGACPPPGDEEHRYFFKLFALDTELDLAPGARKDQLLDAMADHILAEAQLMGTYKRSA